jgi:hypothetical protein
MPNEECQLGAMLTLIHDHLFNESAKSIGHDNQNIDKKRTGLRNNPHQLWAIPTPKTAQIYLEKESKIYLGRQK